MNENELLEIMNAQPFAESSNDPTRVWQLFGERVHVGDAIKAILELAGVDALHEYKRAAGMFAIEKAEQRRLAERLQSELTATRERLAAAEVNEARYLWLRDESIDQWVAPIVVSQRRVVDTMKYIGPVFGDSLDEAIDAAIAASGKGE